MELQNVQLVKKNVTSVNIVQVTVPYVLKEESTPQNVTFHHQPSNLLMLKIFQSDLPVRSFVTINVLPVKEMETTV